MVLLIILKHFDESGNASGLIINFHLLVDKKFLRGLVDSNLRSSIYRINY